MMHSFGCLVILLLQPASTYMSDFRYLCRVNPGSNTFNLSMMLRDFHLCHCVISSCTMLNSTISIYLQGIEFINEFTLRLWTAEKKANKKFKHICLYTSMNYLKDFQAFHTGVFYIKHCSFIFLIRTRNRLRGIITRFITACFSVSKISLKT